MYSLKSKNLTWLAVAGLVIVQAACVDVDETVVEPPPPPTPECDVATRARVRVFQAARGLGVITREGKPDLPQTLTLLRPDPADATKTVTVANLGFGAASIVQLCPGEKTFTSQSQVLQTDGTVATQQVGQETVSVAAMEQITLIVAGNVFPAEGADPVRLVVIRESTFSVVPAGTANLIVANVMPDSPTVTVDANEAAGPDATIARYAVSAPIAISTPDEEVTVTVAEADVTKAAFVVTPRFPAGANLIAILYDTLAPPATTPPAPPSTKPRAKLFLTGSDPLIGNVPGNGIVFPALDNG